MHTFPIPRPDASCQIKPFVHMLDQVKDFGISNDMLYEHTDLSFEALRREGANVSADQEYQLCRNIRKYANDPMVGLKIGSLMKIENLGVLGFATLSAANREQAINIFSQYYELIGIAFQFETEQQDDRFFINFAPRYEIPFDLLPYYCDLQMGALVFSEGDKKETQRYIREVKLMHNQAHLKLAYESFFGCPVSFGHDTNSIVFDRSFAQEPMPRSDSETSRLCEQECKRAMIQLNQNRSIREKVRDVILQKSGEFPNIQQVSQQLEIPERTLRRKLSNEGTSFQELLSTIRFELAKAYLKTELSIEKISDLTGYSEAANFSHAFKRWAKVSPRAYRNKVLTNEQEH